MTLSRHFLVSLTILLTMMSCSSSDEKTVGDEGWHLDMRHRPCESIIATHNAYSTYSCVDTTYADLLVRTQGALIKESSGHLAARDTTLTGDGKIEDQIKKYLDPDNKKYVGDIPIPVEYRTEQCTAIQFLLYKSDNTLISDVTDKARFSYVYGPHATEEIAANLLIDGTGLFRGMISHGCTIQEYLSYSPMVFGDAHFILEGISRESLENGNFVEVTITLSSGKVLKSKSDTYI